MGNFNMLLKELSNIVLQVHYPTVIYFQSKKHFCERFSEHIRKEVNIYVIDTYAFKKIRYQRFYWTNKQILCYPAPLF